MIETNDTIEERIFMRRGQEFPGLTNENAEGHRPDLEGSGELHISDGMDPISVPPRITRENFAALFGATLPDGLSPEIFEDGELELEQG